MEKKFNIVVGEDGTVKLPDAVLEKLEVKPGEEVRFEVDDNFYAVRLLSRIEAERLRERPENMAFRTVHSGTGSAFIGRKEKKHFC